jgi:hypothetical protein
MYKCFNYKLCYLTCKKLVTETCQDLATLYPTSMSVLYSAQCMRTSVFRIQICLKFYVFYLLANLYPPVEGGTTRGTTALVY